jgi:hypothetical protein
LSPPFYKRRVREDYSQPRPAGEWLLLCIKTKKSERGVSCVKKALLKVLSTKYLTFTISTTSIHSAKAREKSLLFVIGNPSIFRHAGRSHRSNSLTLEKVVSSPFYLL